MEQVIEARCKERERQMLRQQAETERLQKTDQQQLAAKLGQLEAEISSLRAALVRGKGGGRGGLNGGG